ncbi:response regulator [Geoanaerobacter pelophilus]|uniref:Response regulator n=1 Tax=Geoanaerobacter pelophilus TaxID=60036 RepID=A0ABQ0MF56_9BACT|nr:response regulator [Geoanaerobacter pelophilus]GAW65737.1 response regulator [Geoanaerobacter pelophilus]
MGNRLLLADDSITIQKVVAIIFANEEFELTVVDNGTAALEKAREIKPDVMLVDALMPGKTGYEVCAEIRRDPRLNSVPILLLIGAFEPLDEEKARDCGADASISKPFESQQLIDRVKEMLALGKSRESAPAPAAAPAAEPSAEELWGDLSSFDAMPAVEAPEAPAFPDAEAVWGNMAAEVEPAAAAPAAPAISVVAAAVQEELVEATQEDDLWGAFELEEVSSAPAAPPAQLFGVVEPEGELEAEELFSFDEDDEDIEETGPALDLEPEAQVEEMPVSISEEEFFALAEEPVAAAEEAPAATAEAESFQFPEYDPFAVQTEATEPQAPAVAALAAEPAKAQQPVAPAAAAAPPAELSEEQLVAALSKVSREVIERIVWEVVPDLAEVLIKEEIRKLRAGERG